MDVNSLLFRIIAFVLSFHMMSFAWPLRGQFGHEWGAAITGAVAGCIVTILVPWKNFRRAFAQAVVFGTIGFILGGENLPYGSVVDDILAQSSLLDCLPQLFTVFFVGASWGCIGGTFLGFGIAEKPMTGKDFIFLAVISGITLLLGSVIKSGAALMIALSVIIAGLHLYNRFVKDSLAVWLMGIYSLLGFGLGFLGAVIILFYGTKGQLAGPPNWWTLRDQIWGGCGGLSLILAACHLVRSGQQPAVIQSTLFQRFGFIFFVPFVCGWNTYNVYTKWFESTPAAPNLTLAGILLAAGVILLLIALIYYLIVSASNYSGPQINTMILGSFLFFTFYLRFFAIAKSVVYSGWNVWETGFTLFLFESLMFFVVMPFILLGNENT